MYAVLASVGTGVHVITAQSAMRNMKWDLREDTSLKPGPEIRHAPTL